METNLWLQSITDPIYADIIGNVKCKINSTLDQYHGLGGGWSCGVSHILGWASATLYDPSLNTRDQKDKRNEFFPLIHSSQWKIFANKYYF